MPDTTPDTIGGYEILRRIGRGIMGTVYHARDPRVGLDVVLKVLPAHILNSEVLDRFSIETLQPGRLHHPNIVTLFRVGEDRGCPFFVTEYVEGDTLGQLFRQRAVISLDSKLDIIEQVCAGLSHAHRAGIVHGDIKPANIMIDRHGTVKISDLGIAHLVAQGGMQSVLLAGTLCYMAPEQITGSVVDTRADVFSAGALFYELLAGRRAFPGKELSDMVREVLYSTPAPLEGIVSDVDLALVDVINGCLAKPLGDRCRDIDDVGQALESLRRRADPHEHEPSTRSQVSPGPEQSHAFGPDTAAALQCFSSESSDAALRAAEAPPVEQAKAPPVEAVEAPPVDKANAPAEPETLSSIRIREVPHGGRTPDLPIREAAATLAKPGIVPRALGRLKGAFRPAGKSRRSSLNSREKPPVIQKPSGMTEEVLLGVSAPRGANCGSEFSARFVAYVEEHEVAATLLLRDLDPAADEPDHQAALSLTPARAGRWVMGTPVVVRVYGDYLHAEPAAGSFQWNGGENMVSFSVSVAPDAPASTTQLCFEAFIEGVSVALIPLTLRIGPHASDADPSVLVSRPASTAFASYASKDASVVKMCLSALKRWDPELDVFMDCLDVAPNEGRLRELERIIPAKDTFLLFWSVNAKASKWVAWELHVAETTKGLAYVRPMPIDDPDVAPPPDQLKHLQFRDRYLIARQGFLRTDEFRH